ncbi:MAG: ribonuclease E/G [Lachnospiraceae bacterium]|nr:ribonuclease E/G [Lachnospiraceae bacterium]
MSRLTRQSIEKETAKELNEMRCSEYGKLIITLLNDKLISFLIQGCKAVCINVLGNKDIFDSESLNSGDIVIAYVRDVKMDIGAAFIEYAKDKDGYLPLNKLPKDFQIKQGDLIPVRLTSDSQKGKRASFTAKIDYSKYPDSDDLIKKSGHLTKYSYLYKDDAFLKDRIDKVFKTHEYNEIVTDISSVYDNLKTSFENVRLYDDTSFDLSKLYSLKTVIEEATDRKVWLKCGGYLCIDHTEAMTVIDVNSGKYSPSKGTDKESAYLSVNAEAAEEICRQLRLRNISGMILIDFINLSSDEDRQLLMDLLKKETLKDTVKVSVLDITALGLVEITRKKELPPLYEQLR